LIGTIGSHLSEPTIHHARAVSECGDRTGIVKYTVLNNVTV
jgi:hypothetical protein